MATALDKIYEQARGRGFVEEQKKSKEWKENEESNEGSTWASSPRPSAVQHILCVAQSADDVQINFLHLNIMFLRLAMPKIDSRNVQNNISPPVGAHGKMGN